MREFQAKKKVRKFLYSKATLALMLVLIIIMAKASWGVLQKEHESAANTLQAAKELEKLTEREKLLNAEIKRLSTNEGIEEEIRSKFSVSKPGEQLLVIVDNATTTATTSPKQESWWGKFKSIFK